MNYLRFLRKIKNTINLTISKLKPKTNSNEVFDKIYKKRLWGKKENDERLFSGEGSYDLNLTDEYIKVIKNLLISFDNPSVLDLGCGDFEVGKHFIPYVKNYIAADVSSIMIEQNKRRFPDTGVNFVHLDGSKNKIPSVDIILLRQVLQHLSNDDIKNMLKNINQSGAKCLCLTEHLPINEKFRSNIDKPTSAGIRLGLGSGVNIEEYPFKFNAESCKTLIDIETFAEGLKSKLVTKQYNIFSN
jgi:SAM-dependent methyltransferase|tara:strand:- start:1936 stop:2667 length:732 start_codon:yes stop_codon:yes gene_type:complete